MYQTYKILHWKINHYKSLFLALIRFPLGMPNGLKKPAQLLESAGIMMDRLLGLVGGDLDRLFNEMLGTVTFGLIQAHGINYYDIINTLSG